jgi:hypothetical protein
MSTPIKGKSEQSSSTLSVKNIGEAPHIFSSKEKKHTRKDKAKSIKLKEEEDIRIKNTEEKFELFQKQLDEIKKDYELKINNLDKTYELKINNLEKEHKEEKEAYELKIDALQKKIGNLDIQVKQLNDFYFSGKLRKLLKRLIEYIIKNYYYSYMKSSPYNRRIYFVKAPRLSFKLHWAKDDDIINALNKLLDLSFSSAKLKDFVVHFFNVRANKDTAYKKIYPVFRNKDGFFEYFKITGKDKIILGEIIPEEYLTVIDNASSDISLKELVNVVRKVKLEEKAEESDY